MISHNPVHHLSRQQRIWKLTFWYSLVACLLLASIIVAHYKIFISAESSQLKTGELLNLKLGKTSIITELSNIQSDVNFLARQGELHRYFDHLDEATLKLMAQEYQLFSSEKKIYDQIRLIDTHGQEIIRINQQDGQSIIVSKNKLQKKTSRYYFRESLQLKRDEIYISPFDLNVEHGKIQIPLKPVIRFGTPVFNTAGEKIGVLILNYLGNRLLENFRTATANISDHIMLLNNDGYWLSHYDRDQEWGFMLDHEHTFASDFANEWKVISSQKSGQLETNNGLFSFTTVYPTLEITGHGQKNTRNEHKPQDFNHPWNLVAFISARELQALPQKFVRNNSLLYLTLLAIFLIASHVIARLRANHQLAEIEVEFEQHFRKVLESIELNVLAIDLSGNITFINDSLVKLLGWSREQLIGKNWVETLVVHRHRDGCKTLFERSLLQGENPGTHESWLQDKSGKEYLLRWHDTFLTDADDKVIGLIFMGEDITQYRQNEIRVRHLSQAVEQSPASVILTNSMGMIEYVNPKFERLTGYTLDEVKGLNPRILKSGETSFEDYSELWRTVKKGGTWRGIFHNRKKNGELYWESASISGIRNPEGEITHFLAVKEDITEQKMLEERFKHCFNAAPVAMVMSDGDGKIILANIKLQKLFGYSEQELLGQNIKLLLPANDSHHPALPGESALVPLRQAQNSNIDFTATTRDGVMFPAEVGVSSTPTLEGKMNISAIIDLTSRMQLESELLQRNEEISRNQALNTVGKMANMIAHDLRNPLSSIKMGLQILSNQQANMSLDDTRELNQIALEQVHYMEEILADLMSYSRPDALNMEWLDIQKLLDTSINLVQREIEASGARISTWYEKGLPIISADARKLRQVITNLLTNAIQSVESIEDLQPEINISVQLDLSAEQSFIKISISDNGSGIDENDVEKLFEPFYTSRAKGTGLGLAIAKRFIELQHGQLLLKTAENGGTVAIVLLNIDPAQ
jgi:PAS domain S-box-containing protein